MTNEALPQRSRQMLENYLDRCQNLGLILDKFAPWGENRGSWDLSMRSTIRRRGQDQIQILTGGEAKGLWLSTSRQAKQGESPSLFETNRTDTDLMHAMQRRWLDMVRDNDGVAFTMTLSERLVAGLGASHVLETALTLDRSTGLPYLPGSTVKGLARAWGLIEVAAQLGVSLDDKVKEKQRGETVEIPLLNKIAEFLISEPSGTSKQTLFQKIEQLPVSIDSKDDVEAYIQWFRLIFGWQGEAGAISFVDAIYAGEREPQYAADVMTPHYVNYYTENGGQPPAEDDNPNPVSFITVDAGNKFGFGLLPRKAAFTTFGDAEANNRDKALEIAMDWLGRGLTQLGIGSKTGAGYGFFNRRSFETVIG